MRVLGESVARCDATLVRGTVAVVDPEISGWNDVVHLSEEGLSRFREVELLPREWLRLATRIGPHYRLLEGTCYSRFGEPEYTDQQRRDILEGRTPKGRDGKPIEGHHKQPVEDHPDLADDPDNIEFLDWPDHLDAHGKSPRK